MQGLKNLSEFPIVLSHLTNASNTKTPCLLFILQPPPFEWRLNSQSHHAFTNSYSIYWPIKSLTRVFEFSTKTLKMASAQVVETSVTNNSPSQDSNQPRWSFSIKVRYFFVQTIFYLLNMRYSKIETFVLLALIRWLSTKDPTKLKNALK